MFKKMLALLCLLVFTSFLMAGLASAYPGLSHEVCENCHIGDFTIDHYDCVKCHDGEINETIQLRNKPQNIVSEFNKTYTHPINWDDPNGTCNSCHNSKGDMNPENQNYSKLLRSKNNDTGEYVYAGNDFCYSCHGEGSVLKGGNLRRFETSGHNSSLFPTPESGTLVRCSTCHNAHGGEVRSLAKASDAELCGKPDCHPDGSYELKTDNELVYGLGGPDSSVWDAMSDQLAVFSQDVKDRSTFDLKGPKTYMLPNDKSSSYWSNTSGFGLSGISAGDANNDGHNDIIANSRVQNSGKRPSADSHSLALFKGRADNGGIEKPVFLPTKISYDKPTVGDYKSDGKNEVIVTSQQANEVMIYRIEGSDIETIETINLTSRGSETGIGELNGDEKNDLAVLQTDRFTVFPSGTTHMLPATGAKRLVVADVTNDGKDDVIVANLKFVYVYSQQADGTLALYKTVDINAVGLSGSNLSLRDLVVGDLNISIPGNEIAFNVSNANVTNSTNQIHIFNALNSSWKKSIPMVPANVNDGGTYRLAAGDINGDGKDDIATNGYYVATILLQNENGDFETKQFKLPSTNYAYQAEFQAGILIADIGNINPYGHKAELMEVDSCTKCHDPHAVNLLEATTGQGVEPEYDGKPTAEKVFWDNTSRILFGGSGWTVFQTLNTYMYQYRYTTWKDAYAHLNFTGTGVALVIGNGNHGSTTTNLGQADIYVDGVFKTRVDYSANYTAHNSRYIYKIDGLPYGNHSIRVVNAGVKGENSNNTQITVDYFEIYNKATYSLVAQSDKQYQICLKCHSDHSDNPVGVNIADDFNPNNASSHAVIGPSKRTRDNMPDEWFVNGWNAESRLDCNDCHGKAPDIEGQLRHTSEYPYMLTALSNISLGIQAYQPSIGEPPENHLCYQCHSTYYYRDKGYAMRQSNFEYLADDKSFTDGDKGSYHAAHVRFWVRSCFGCHESSHGSSTRKSMVRPELGLKEVNGKRGCTAVCHGAKF